MPDPPEVMNGSASFVTHLSASDKLADKTLGICSNIAESLSVKIPREPQHFCYLKENRHKKETKQVLCRLSIKRTENSCYVEILLLFCCFFPQGVLYGTLGGTQFL